MEEVGYSRREIESCLIARALRDDEFRQTLIADPKAALDAELSRLRLDIKFPWSLKVKVLQETPDTLYLILPPDLVAPEEGSEQFFLDAVRSMNQDGH